MATELDAAARACESRRARRHARRRIRRARALQAVSVRARVRLRARHALPRRHPRRRSQVARAAEQGARGPHGARRRRHPRSRQNVARARRRARAYRRREAIQRRARRQAARAQACAAERHRQRVSPSTTSTCSAAAWTIAAIGAACAASTPSRTEHVTELGVDRRQRFRAARLRGPDEEPDEDAVRRAEQRRADARDSRRARACIARHGEDHRLAPHEINYRANLWALEQRGVRACIGINTVGAIDASLHARRARRAGSAHRLHARPGVDVRRRGRAGAAHRVRRAVLAGVARAHRDRGADCGSRFGAGHTGSHKGRGSKRRPRSSASRATVARWSA